MYTIHLQVEDDYIEELMRLLPKDKVRVIEEDFKQNKLLLQTELENYKQNSLHTLEYFEYMKNIDSWLEERS